jgi:hypothetical protein
MKRFNESLENKVETEPTELISVATVKDHLHIDGTEEDTYLTSLIKQCRKRVENYCSISIGSQSREGRIYLNYCDEFRVPYGPLLSVESLEYVNPPNDNEDMTEDEDFVVMGDRIKSYRGGEFAIEYTAGYETLPYDLGLALLNEIAFRYENRGDGSLVSEGAKSLLTPYKRTFGI